MKAPSKKPARRRDAAPQHRVVTKHDAAVAKHDAATEAAISTAAQQWKMHVDFRTAVAPFLRLLQDGGHEVAPASLLQVVNIVDALCYAVAYPQFDHVEDLHAPARAVLKDRDLVLNRPITIPEREPERSKAIYQLREIAIDDLRELAEHGESNEVLARELANLLSIWRGTDADRLTVEQSARLLEGDFNRIDDKEPLDADEVVRVRIARALKRFGAAPQTTTARRMAKSRAVDMIWDRLSDPKQASGADARRLANQLVTLLTEKFRGCIRVQDPDAAATALLPLLKSRPKAANRKTAERVVEALWTHDIFALPAGHKPRKPAPRRHKRPV